MARRSRTKRSRKRSGSNAVIKSASEAMHPASTIKLSYHGPMSLPGSMMQNAPIVASLFYTSTISSDAVGLISTIYNNDPSVYADFSNYASLYDEYRYLGIELEFFPNNRYSKTTTTCLPGVGVVDRDDTTALASVALGFQYESNMVLSLEDPWTDRRHYRGALPSLKMKMNGAKEATWITTATPVATGCIKIRFEGLSSSTQYGRILVRGLFQFRGRD